MSQPASNLPDPVAPAGDSWFVAFFAAVMIFGLLLWLCVVGQLVFFVPRSRKTFDDFKMKVPPLTHVIVHDFWWMVPALVVVGVTVCLVTRSRWAWLIVLVLLPLVLNVLIFWSVYTPTANLLEGLAK